MEDRRRRHQKALEHAYRVVIAPIRWENDEEKSDEKKRFEDFQSNIRTRARALPTFFYDYGLISTLAFIYAKSTDAVYKEVANFFQSYKEGDKIPKKFKEVEKGSYSIYLYAILSWLREEGFDVDPLNPLESLKVLAEKSPQVLSMAIKSLEPLIYSMKELCEAVYGG